MHERKEPRRVFPFPALERAEQSPFQLLSGKRILPAFFLGKVARKVSIVSLQKVHYISVDV